MGDRALVIFTDGESRFSPEIYLHWGGVYVGEFLAETRKLMVGRDGDVAYTAARFAGICHEHTPGNLSLGIHNAPQGTDYAEILSTLTDKGHSPGDAGVFIVNIRHARPGDPEAEYPELGDDGRTGGNTWRVEVHHGYGFHDENVSGMVFDTHKLAYFPPTS